MGQIPNKTYTAPDGSVYHVEADGSVTKIKGGRVQSNEPPSKYNITPEGKIYRIEDDGSVTYLGNAEDRQNLQHYDITANTKKSGHKWVWVIVLVIIIVATAFGIFISNKKYSRNNDNYIQPTMRQYSSNVESCYESPDQSTEYIHRQENTSSNEVPADYDAQYAFIVDGNFYGTIGNARIHGNLTLDTENPSGVLYYSENGNGEALEIYETSDGNTWSEYYNDNNTGRIDFSFWDLAYKNFARGTYTRYSDGKQFHIELYKTNF